jgi:cell division septation protein DedD
MGSRQGSGAAAARPVRAAQALLLGHADRGNATLKRQLRSRMGIAGLLLVALLAGLLLLDHWGAPDEQTANGALFTEPVPVRKRPLPPPVKAAESPSEALPLPPLAAGPQASGEAIERLLRLATPSTTLEGATAAAATSPAGTTESTAGVEATAGTPVLAPRVLSGPALQSGFLPDVRRAEELQAKLAQDGIPASIETRLQLGPFKTRAEAEAARRKMQALGIDTLLVMRKGGKP